MTTAVPEPEDFRSVYILGVSAPRFDVLRPLVFCYSLAGAVLFSIRPVWFPLSIDSAALAWIASSSSLWSSPASSSSAAHLLLAWTIFARAEKAICQFPQVQWRLELLWHALPPFYSWVSRCSARAAGPKSPTAPGKETIEVDAHQFAWNFRYPGPDGVFGHTANQFISDAGGNPVGHRSRRIPPAKTISSRPRLRIPAGRDVLLLLHSRDVIHDFFVRELRTKQDIVPGMEIPLEIHVDTPGTYEIACAELCGLGHSQMRSVLIVMPPGGIRPMETHSVEAANARASAASAGHLQHGPPRHRAPVFLPFARSQCCSASSLSLLMRFHLVYPAAQVGWFERSGPSRRSAA